MLLCPLHTMSFQRVFLGLIALLRHYSIVLYAEGDGRFSTIFFFWVRVYSNRESPPKCLLLSGFLWSSEIWSKVPKVVFIGEWEQGEGKAADLFMSLFLSYLCLPTQNL